MKQSNRGLSLIEVMIAMVIGLLLLLGLLQVFAASKTAYQVSEGLARVQENGRFALDYLQRDIRMAGHYGCVNDQSRLLPQGVADPFLSHLAGLDGRVAFGRSMQGYEAVGTVPGDAWNIATAAGTWNPVLPEYLATLANPPKAGSDVIVLRFFSSEGIPVRSITSVTGTTTITVDNAKWPVLKQDGIDNPSLFAVSDCSYSDVFQAASTTPATGTITFKTNTGLNSAVDFTERYTASPSGQTMLYRAESVAYYIANGANDEPALYRLRFNPVPGAGLSAAQPPEELVEGIENLQFLYGQDANAVDSLNGNITQYYAANSINLATTETNWRRVGMVRVGILARSPTPSAAPVASAAAATLVSLGVTFSPVPTDQRYRMVYESAIAERNRLFGN